MKEERGAHLIRERADLLLDNNGTFEDSVVRMMDFVESLDSIVQGIAQAGFHLTLAFAQT